MLWLDRLGELLARLKPVRWRPGARRAAGQPVAAVRAWWGRRSRLARQIISNLVVGLVIAVGLLFLHGAPWLRDLEDAGIDWVMARQWGAAPPRPDTPIVFLDIDEATYQAWGEPFHTPRDRLRKLIAATVQSQAALIVVDVDLSQAGHDSAADDDLRAYLAGYGDTGQPPLLLVRALRPPAPPSLYPTARRSFLEADPRIASAPRIFWGSTLYELDGNRVLRRWRLWETVCADGAPKMTPALQVLAAAMLNLPHKDPQATAQAVTTALQPLAPARCDGAPVSHGHGGGAIIEAAGLRLSAAPDALAQRIIYTLPWQLEGDQAYSRLPWRGAEVPLLKIISARGVTENDQPPAPAALAGRVVVIGGSYAASRDLYATPLGEMPGALVIVNAIRSLYQYGEITPPPWYVKLLVEAVLIILMSVLFAGFSSFWGMVASSAAVIVLLLPLSFLFFKAGVWLDFAIPLLAVQLHQIASEFEEAVHAHGHNQSS